MDFLCLPRLAHDNIAESGYFFMAKRHAEQTHKKLFKFNALK
jgi:hypothetical protein